MRLGVFGGSFNPPHSAHVMIATLVLSSELVDRILVLPCHAHPFDKDLADFEHRLEMCRLAFALFGDKVEVSDLEARRGGRSYTVDTLRWLIEEMPDVELRLITGSDIIDEFPRWRAGAEVQRLAPPVIVGRGERSFELPDGWDLVWDHPLPDISSTGIRQALAGDGAGSVTIPAAVRRYIKKNGLYGRSGGE